MELGKRVRKDGKPIRIWKKLHPVSGMVVGVDMETRRTSKSFAHQNSWPKRFSHGARGGIGKGTEKKKKSPCRSCGVKTISNF